MDRLLYYYDCQLCLFIVTVKKIFSILVNVHIIYQADHIMRDRKESRQCLLDSYAILSVSYNV